MKKIFISTIIALALFVFVTCEKETSDIKFSKIAFSYKNIDGDDSTVTEAKAGASLKITLLTDASTNGMCVVWPGGSSDTLKSIVNPEADSIDSRGIVMEECDNYRLTRRT